MKTSFFLSTVGAILLLGISTPAALAQTTNAPASTSPSTPATCTKSGKHHHLAILTAAERAQLKQARTSALAANPDLKTQRHSLKQQFATATPDQRKALHQQAHALRDQLRAAELKVDPTLAPVFAKIDAAKQGHHHAS